MLKLQQDHGNDIPDDQQPDLTSAVQRLTLSAWQIDSAGDLGNKEKIAVLYERRSTRAVGEILGTLWRHALETRLRTSDCGRSSLGAAVLVTLGVRTVDAHKPVTSKLRLQSRRLPAAPRSLRALPCRGRRCADVAHDVTRKRFPGPNRFATS